MAAAKVKINANFNDDSFVDRLESMIHQDDKLAFSIHNTLARYCHPYVPYLHGPLSETFEVTRDYVQYIQPYARRQYYGDDFNFTKDKHPLATSRWDEAMMRDRGDEFCNEVSELITRRWEEIND